MYAIGAGGEDTDLEAIVGCGAVISEVRTTGCVEMNSVDSGNAVVLPMGNRAGAGYGGVAVI
jgi:hypothetical protein